VYACATATIAIDTGDDAMLASTLPELAASAKRLSWGVFIRANYSRALAALGRLDEARAQLARVVEGDFARLPRDFVHLATLVQIAETAIAVGEGVVIGRVRSELAPYAGQLVTGAATFALGSSWRFLGRLAVAAGDSREALAALDAAVRHDAEMGAWP